VIAVLTACQYLQRKSYIPIRGLPGRPRKTQEIILTIAMETVKRFFCEESGQDLIEYALVAAVIALGAIVSMSTLAAHMRTEFNNIGSSI
jgi:pilus assembly protein Flp/PilA